MMEVDHIDSTFDSTLDCTMSAPSTPGGSPPLAIPQKITTTSTPTSSMSGSPPRVRVLKPNGISSPTTPKRRRITTESSVSGCDSPLNVSVDTVSLLSAEDSSMYSDGNQSMSPCSSPSAFRSACAKADFRGKYKKDELWASIRSDYHYIMDKEIIETCKSTESDLSWESDEVSTNSKVSLDEFDAQYKELTEWLHQIQHVTMKQGSSLSEKYLNQTYHEEMLQRSPRRKLLNDYAKQLLRRYPSMKEDIKSRLQHLNQHWAEIESRITAQYAPVQHGSMIRDLEQDLSCLRKWLNSIENELRSVGEMRGVHWNQQQLQEKLQEHVDRQRDIESRSKIVSSVLKLCTQIQTATHTPESTSTTQTNGLDRRKSAADTTSYSKPIAPCTNGDRRKSDADTSDTLRVVAQNLETRWHGIWLQSLEWQYRLEEAISTGKGFGGGAASRHRGGDLDYSSQEESYLDYLPEEGLESDCSNYDTIPFSESEYEKITVDPASGSSREAGELSPAVSTSSSDGRLTSIRSTSSTTSSRSSNSDDVNLGLDSALGRSVSDQSIGARRRQQEQTTRRLGKAICKVVSFADKMHQSDADSADGHGLPSSPVRRPIPKSESHDVGYSSESHSTEEPDGTTTAPHGSIAALACGGVDNVVVRRQKSNTCEADDDQHEKQWRHSMTSAYDTSSNCSDTNCTSRDLDSAGECDGDCALDSPCVEVAHHKVQDLINVPSRKFYMMTQVETDNESPSKGSNMLKYVGSTSETASNEGRQSSEGVTINLANRIKGCKKNLSLPLVLDNERTKSPLLDTWPAMCVINDSESVDPSDNSDSGMIKDYRSDSLQVLMSSEPGSRELSVSLSELSSEGAIDGWPLSQRADRKCVQRLIQQADMLVRETDSQKASKWQHRKRKPSQMSEPVLSTEDSQASSCDASSECTSDSISSDAVYSPSASECSDNDNATLQAGSSMLRAGLSSSLTASHGSHGNSTLCDLSGSGQTLLSSSSPALARRKRLTAKRNATRQDSKSNSLCSTSITELYELTNGLDMSPFSISEGAIYDMSHSKHGKGLLENQNLRRAASDNVSLGVRKPASPKRRRRKNKKSTSADSLVNDVVFDGRQTHTSVLNVTKRLLTSTPLTPRRKGRNVSDGGKGAASKTLFPSEKPRSVNEGVDSDDTDAMNLNHSMNSTIESFSETAWDNYQDPLYPSVSDDPTEEKLDDSKLMWEDNSLEYEDDDYITAIKHTQKAKKLRNVMHKTLHPDSDSDLEDLQHVIDESRTQLNVAENALNKKRRDVMGTGIYLDPSKYAELLATCGTNIRCLQVIVDTLDMEQSATTVTDNDIQLVEDLASQWETLQSVALQRQRQSSTLGCLYKQLRTCQKNQRTWCDQLEHKRYSSMQHLEHRIQTLQGLKHDMCVQRSKLSNVFDDITSFDKLNVDINVTQFYADSTSMRHNLDVLIERCGSVVMELQSLLVSWHSFTDGSNNMNTLLKQEQQQLHCLQLAADIVGLSRDEAKHMINDIQAVQSEFSVYESKLQTLTKLCTKDLGSSLTDDLCVQLLHQTNNLKQHLRSVRHGCSQLYQLLLAKSTEDCTDGQTDILCDGQTNVKCDGTSTMETVTSTTSTSTEDLLTHRAKNKTLSHRANVSSTTSVTSQTPPIPVAPVANVPQRPFLRKLFRTAVPLLILAAIMLLLIEYGSSDGFQGLVVSPQLKYVRGPPPV